MSSIINGVSNVAGDVVHGVESAADGVVHGVEGAYNDVKNGIEDIMDGGAQVQATPQINSHPPAPVQPASWKAPDVSANGKLTVDHGALTQASSIIKKSLPDLEKALEKVAAHSGAFDSLMSWSTGKQFGTNMNAAVSAFSATGKQASDAHAQAASNLQSSAQSYSDVEATNAKAASNIGSGSSTTGSPSTATSSQNWGK